LYRYTGERDAATIADWTDTPKDQATREQRLFLAAQEQRYALPAVQAAAANAQAKQHEVLVDDFNERRRPKTLLEQHADRQEKESKAGQARAKAGLDTTFHHIIVARQNTVQLMTASIVPM
jgi:hypothetical protein